MLRLLRMIGLGLLLAGGVIMLVASPGTAWWLLPVGLPLVILTSLLIAVGRDLAGTAPAPEALVRSAVAAGRVGAARVDALHRTGTLINDQPLFDVDLTVQPRHGAAYRTTMRVIQRRDGSGHVDPGLVRPVAILAEGEPDVALLDGSIPVGPGPLPEVPPASDALPLRERSPYPLTTAGTRRRPLIGIGRRGRPVRAIVYVLVLVLTAGLCLAPYRASLEQTIAALPEGRLHLDMRSGEAIEAALAAVREETGHDRVVSVVALEDLVVIDAPIAEGALETDEWIYRRGVLEHSGPAPSQPEQAGEQFPTSDVAWDALLPAARDAAAQQGLDDPGDVTFSVRRTMADDPEAGWTGPVRVSFTIDTDYTSRSYHMEADGSGLTAA